MSKVTKAGPREGVREKKSSPPRPKGGVTGTVQDEQVRVADIDSHGFPKVRSVATPTVRKPTAHQLSPGKLRPPAALRGRAAKPRRKASDVPTLDDLLTEPLPDPTLWLATPNVRFGGRKPGDLVGTKEEEQIYYALRAADLGLF